MKTIEEKIYSRICRNGAGWVFSNKDFSEIAGSATIDVSLYRLLKAGKIRKVCHGIYDYPKYSEFLKQTLSPDLDLTAKAIARKLGWRIQPEGNTALNLLGLSNQVPGRIVYLSDGPDRCRSYKIGKQILEIRNIAKKEIGFKHFESGLLVQALRALGRNHVTDDIIEKIRDAFPAKTRNRIIADTSYVTGWIREIIIQICQKAKNE